MNSINKKKALFLCFYDEILLNTCPYFVPPGPVYCATAMAKQGIAVHSFPIEYHKLQASFDSVCDAIKETLDELQIKVICFSAMSVDFVRVRQIVARLKEFCPYITVILGGGCVSADPIFVLTHTDADYGLIGEGEVALPTLVNMIIEGAAVEKISTIDNLVYIKNEKCYVNPIKDIADINSIAFPDYSLFPTFEAAIKGSGIYPIVISRSCPFKCSFCFHTSGNKYRCRSIENVIAEIDEVMAKYQLKHLFIMDELFGADKSFVNAFVDYISTLNITFNMQTRADLITPQLVQKLKHGGCTNVSVGIESVCQEILDSMNKHLTPEIIQRALDIITDCGLKTNGNIIIGDAEETFETAIKSINWFCENQKRYNLNIGHIQVYPGTAIFDYAIKKGLIDKEEFLLRAKDEKDFIFNITKMSDEDYLKIYKKINSLRFLTETDKDYLF